MSIDPTPTPAWSPLNAKQRRILGVLMEKSKTTPDAYPMTFAGLTTGCNQKTNRLPITNFTTDQVEQIVDELRKLGALALVQGSGRVEKVRHYAYQWLGLSKIESAVMTELLLRGEQTVGDLRTRASRMEPIPDLGVLQDLLRELVSRNLVVMLTPPGRGQVVSHNLYPEWELEDLRKRVSAGYVGSEGDEAEDEPTPQQPSTPIAKTPSQLTTSSTDTKIQDQLAELREMITSLQARIDHLERELGVA